MVVTNMRDLPPVHPGEQLREEFMKPLGLTAYRLAKDINVPVTRVQGHHCRAARYHRRYGAPSRPVFRNDT